MEKENKNVIVNSDLLDEELMSMPGLNAAKGSAKPATKAANKQIQKPAAQVNKPKSTVTAGGKYIAQPNDQAFAEGIEKVKECAKTTLLFGGLSLLLFYWQQTGQMLPSAAYPSIVVCVLLTGICIGKSIGN